MPILFGVRHLSPGGAHHLLRLLDEIRPELVLIEGPGDLSTLMAGLACGEPCTVGWPILRDYASAYVSCPDYVAANGMRLYAAARGGDTPLVSGESGAVGMGLIAAIMETDEYKELREAIGLDRFSQVLMFSTEGNTDPMKFRKVLWDGEYPTA